MRHLNWAAVPLAALAAAITFGAASAQGPGAVHSLSGGGTLTDLTASGALTAADINASGQVCGQISVNNANRAYLWTPAGPNGASGSFKVLDLPKGYVGAAAHGLNDRGDVVGAGGTNNSFSKALLWEVGKSAILLSSKNNFDQASARAINMAGNVTGWNPTNGGAFLSAVVKGKRTFTIIGDGIGKDINASGEILAYGSPGWSPYVWTPSVPNGTSGSPNYIAEGFGNPDGGINDLSQVAGSIRAKLEVDGVEYDVYHPMLYLPAAAHGLSAGAHNLGFPPPPALGEWVYGVGNAISEGGLVVGWCQAFDLTDPSYPVTEESCWIRDPADGVVVDLNHLLQGSGWRLTSISAVNDARQIVGMARYHGGSERAVLLNLP
jgi:hypothetical protein